MSDNLFNLIANPHKVSRFLCNSDNEIIKSQLENYFNETISNELFCKIMDDIQSAIIKEQVTKVIDSMINDITINLILM